jgi:hypothetical protein
MVQIANATLQNIRANRADRRAEEEQERRRVVRGRQDAAFEQLQGEYGDIAGDPTLAGQLAGIERNEVEFDQAQEDRQRALRLQAAQNAYRLAARMGENGVPAAQQAERAGRILQSFGYGAEEVNAAIQPIVNGEATAADLLGSVFQEEQRQAEYGQLQAVRGPNGQEIYVREVVQPDGSRAFVDTQGNPVEGFSPYREPRQSTGQTWETLDPEDPRAVRAGISGRGYQISDRGNIRRIPGSEAAGGSSQLFGAEARARVATNLPTLVGAFDNMRGLIGEGVSFRGGADATEIGRNVGATIAEQFIPVIGDDIGRSLGSADRTRLRQAADAYEAALLPIMSGAAVTDTEARRTIRGSIPAPGDSPEILAIKLAQMNAMNTVFQQGLEGDDVDFTNVAENMRLMERQMRAEFGLPADESVADSASDAPFDQQDDAGSVPEGVDPADWEYMTPEERALWQ